MPILDLGAGLEVSRVLLEMLEKQEIPFGIRVPDLATAHRAHLLEQARLVILTAAPSSLAGQIPAQPVLVEVGSLVEARRAAAAGAAGLVARGRESQCGHDGLALFVLLQQLLASGELSVHALGVGTHTAPACIAGGAAGVVLTPDQSCAEIHQAIASHLQQAKTLLPLAPRSRFAAQHGIEYPLVQGPMSRVSDRPAFARAVAEAGGMPVLALGLLRGEPLERLLAGTAHLQDGLPFGVGLIGFAPQEVRKEQQEAVFRARPALAVLAGGRPSQARPLEEQGIPTYLHVPSPGLLDLFLQDGARRFIFEGNECGGHIGPKTSFSLWQEQIDSLLAFEAPEELSVLFAGGIHDHRSAAMVSALAAPLCARGAAIGILMGTAYLFTREAVSTGAIHPVFQEVLCACARTAVLETSPGHAIRCAESDYVQTFHARHKELRAAGKSAEESWAALERMNLGRLRVATKAEQQQDEREDHFVLLEPQSQRKEGLFMAGEIAGLRAGVCSMAELHRDVTAGAATFLQGIELARPQEAPRPGAREGIAVIGMACLFPGSSDLDEFWTVILDGANPISEVDPARWNPALYFDPQAGIAERGRKTPSKRGGFIPEVDFDPLSFGIPPRSVGAIEPVQLLALQIAKRALGDAGYDQRAFDRERTAVIFGAETGCDLSAALGFRTLFPMVLGEIPDALDRALPQVTEDTFPGILVNVIAGRIANRLDLGGTNYTVDAACASSLAAVNAACQELWSGQSDMVICGGADLHNSINDYLMFSSMGILSPEGQCKTFDVSANGIVLAEGIGALVLKRLPDAERDGDRVYAVIQGVAGSSDGKAVGLTVPNKDGQMRAVRQAYQMGGISPAEIQLVEAHGTGTVVGDRIELGTLTEVFSGAGARPASCALGSVKSQIGHAKCAAGMAGMIKAVLSLHHKVLPPTLHVQKPNPGYDPATSPFVFASKVRPWVSARRKAAVSAFGFGGSNFHAVLSEAPRPKAEGWKRAVWPAELFLFRGDSRQQAEVTQGKLLAVLLQDPPLRLADLAHAVCATGQGPVQLALVARDFADLRTKLEGLRDGKPSLPGVFARGAVEGKVAFLLPGQGSQRPGMLAELFAAHGCLDPLLGLAAPFGEVMFPPEALSDQARAAQRTALARTEVAQPCLGIADLALAALLAQVGIEADMLAGHSYGELVALHLAGCMSQEELIRLSVARGEAINQAIGDRPGGMLAVFAGPDAVREVLQGHPEVSLANHNAPEQTVISGPLAALEAAKVDLSSKGLKARRLPVSAAFHSPEMAPARARFAIDLQSVQLGAPKKPVYSNVTADAHGQDPQEIRARLAEHLTSTVRFVEEIQAMYQAGARIFVEVGPGQVLSGLVSGILGDRPHAAIPMDEEGRAGLHAFLLALARLSVHQVSIRTEALFAGRDTRPSSLDAVPLRSPSTWKINGHRARPMTGEAPAFALRPFTEPLRLVAAAEDEMSPDQGKDEIVLEYLKGVRELMRAQREVLLSYLGAAPPMALPEAIAEVVRPATAPAPRPAPLPPPMAPSRSTPAAQPAATDIQALLLAIVSERTGYPAEMLSLDLDLAADLSIDSIKKMEILGELSKKTGLGQGDISRRDALIEELAGRKTLRDILAVLGPAQPPVPAEANPRQPPVALAAAKVSLVPLKVGRYVLELTDAPPIRNGLTAEGKTFAITDDGHGIARLLAELLQQKGAQIRILGWDDEPGKVDGLIYLSSLHPALGTEIVKNLFQRVQEALAGGASWILAATSLGGTFGHEGEVDEAQVFLQGGVSGMLKTVAKEWPKARVRVVDFHVDEAAEVVAATLYQELLASDDLIEVGYRGGARKFLLPILSKLNGDHDKTPIHIGPDSVILLTGGARGITGQVARALAQKHRPHLVLVGRSLLSIEEELSPEISGARDLVGIRRALVQLYPGRSPAEIDAQARRILSEREVSATLRSIREAGARVEYHNLDVRDPAEFGALLDDLYARFGKIDGVIHGAGVIEDKFLVDKTLPSFNRVFDTKVESARTLLAKLRDDVGFVVFFSSVSGAFGNRGQVDYAAANDTLDKLARSLHRRIRGRVVSINWGPWAATQSGLSMVSPELEAEYEKSGIGVISIEQGVESMLAELTRGERGDSQVILVRADPDRLFMRGKGLV